MNASSTALDLSTSCAEEWNALEKTTRARAHTLSRMYSDSFIGRERNRYKDIHSIPDMTVMTTDGRPPEASGINYWPGNRIRVADADVFLSQAPLREYIPAFFETIINNNISHIYMLTPCMENGREKSPDYFSSKSISDTSDGDDAVKRELLVNVFGKGWILLTHYHYFGWRDHGTPNNTESFERMLVDMLDKIKSGGRILIHCSAGAGRTGVVAAIIRGILHNEKGYDAVSAVRNSRLPLVQNISQYLFVRRFLSSGLKPFFQRWYSSDTNVFSSAAIPRRPSSVVAPSGGQ